MARGCWTVVQRGDQWTRLRPRSLIVFSACYTVSTSRYTSLLCASDSKYLLYVCFLLWFSDSAQLYFSMRRPLIPSSHGAE